MQLTESLMLEDKYKIHTNGKIDLNVGGITIESVVPYMNDRPVLTASVIVEPDHVCYRSEGSEITLSLREEDDEVIVSAYADGFDGVHDIEPIGEAELQGADHVYVQGFGMEGPSGYFEIDDTLRRSYGIIGLAGSNGAVAVYTLDHRHFTAGFCVSECSRLFSGRKTFTAGINVEGVTRGRVVLPEIHIMAGSDVVSCMKRAAEKIAAYMEARTSAEPGFHWCSWYYHYENMDQRILDDLLTGQDRRRVDFNYIQLDAGYTDHIGDWNDINRRYPGGLEGAAASIIRAGYGAGIWIAPFLVGDESATYREHPDWIVRNADGTPRVVFRSYTEPKIWGNTDNDYYILDTTNPGAYDYLRGVFTSLRSAGYTLYKIDFILWGMADSSQVIRYDNSMTSVEILRRTLEMIRNTVGEESYILGSIAPFMPCIGYADGMRIAGDVGAQWSDKYGPENLLQELPYDNYFNNVFWQNDPDAVILRDFGTHLTDAETVSIALLQAVSGGIITTSDPVYRLSEERRQLLEFIRPTVRETAEFPFLTEDREEIVITHILNDWNLLYVMNPTQHPLRVHFSMEELFGTEALFQYRFEWTDGEKSCPGSSTCFSETLAPHDSVLLFLTEEPMNGRPSNIWDRRQVIL